MAMTAEEKNARRRAARAERRAAEAAAMPPPAPEPSEEAPRRRGMAKRSDTSVSLEKALHDRFRAVCAATGMSQSERLRWLIAEDVDAHERREAVA